LLVAIIPPLAAAETAPRTVRVLVVNREEKQLVILDATTREIVAKVPTGSGSHEVAASEDGKLAIVSNYGDAGAPGNTLSIIDINAAKELRRGSVAPLTRPHGLAVSGGNVWFTAEANQVVGRFNLGDNAVDRVVGTAQKLSHMIVVDRKTEKLYTSNIVSGSVSAIAPVDPPARWDVVQISTAKGPEAIALSPDGKQVWVGHRPTGGISIIDTATQKVTATIAVEPFVFRLAFTPDGQYVLATVPDGGVVEVFEAATGDRMKRIETPGGSPVTLAMDPDSTRAFVAMAGANRVYIIDLKTFEVVASMPSGGSPDGIAVAVR
ncbi:MAG TPA: YncE family protein, partial [Thermoanaerobaculia bacterium]|nr:YncE family protein [Thermoanaerobaculia bacterium]